ncbi:glutamate racemase [Sinobacterium caligoides]|nr:glutamate racemase [Sinobacterium caligoides]
MTNNPIGIFDSGIGGLSIAQQIRQALPHENLIYLADSAYAPYGDKPTGFIQQRSSKLAQFLLEQHKVKAIVVACNTATVSAIDDLRAQCSIPIIGVEPGIKPAATDSNSGIIGVIATTCTLNSTSFQRLSAQLSAKTTIATQPCPGLVEQVESLQLHNSNTEQLVRKYLSPLIAKGIDSIVLGCTHYAFLEPIIRRVAGPDVSIINTATAISKEVGRRLEALQLLNHSKQLGRDVFWSSSDTNFAYKQFSQLWGHNVDVLPLKV